MDFNVGDTFIPIRRYLSARHGKLCTICEVTDSRVGFTIEGIFELDGTLHRDWCTRGAFEGFLEDTGATLMSVLREPDWEI
jgi:hypothetical protein